MKNMTSSAAATYTPQEYKTFTGALCAFLEKEFPQLMGNQSRIMLAQVINEMVSKFFPKAENLRPGEVPWITVGKDEFSSYGKSISQTELVPVTLTLIQSNDAHDRAEGRRLREIKKESAIRLATEAYEQGGCMTNAEIAILLKISTATVSKYIKEWELENKKVVPRRGSIHDIGPTLTHKKIIIHKLFIEQKSVQQTSRETFHSLPAIQRYISTFRQVMLCVDKNMNTNEIAYAIGRTARLVKEYEAIIDCYANQRKKLKEIINKHVDIENNIEEFANEYGQPI